MLNFIKWLELKEQSTLGTEEVDARQIETFYKKAGLSVKLAQEFELLPRYLVERWACLSVKKIKTLFRKI